MREYFQFGKEENRIYEALIARITLSFLAYNLTSYINRINNEPQTLGELLRNLECQLETLAISMELFIKILEQLVQAQEIVKRNKDLEQIILMLRVYTKKQLGFICESWVNKSIAIFDELRNVLDFDGGEVAYYLDGLYLYQIETLFSAGVDDNINSINQVIKVTQGLIDAWKEETGL